MFVNIDMIFLHVMKKKLPESAEKLLTMVIGHVDSETIASNILYIKPLIFFDRFDLSKFYNRNFAVTTGANKKEQQDLPRIENTLNHDDESKVAIFESLEKQHLLSIESISSCSEESKTVEPHKKKSHYDEFLSLNKELCVEVGKNLVGEIFIKEGVTSKSIDTVEFEEELDNSLAWVSDRDANPNWPEHVRSQFERLKKALKYV